MDEDFFQHLNYKLTQTRRFILEYGTIIRTKWGYHFKKSIFN